MSPHSRLRQESLFLQIIDEDRRRRAEGRAELERMDTRRRPLAAATMFQKMQAGSIRPLVTAGYFNGG